MHIDFKNMWGGIWELRMVSTLFDRRGITVLENTLVFVRVVKATQSIPLVQQGRDAIKKLR